MLLFIWVWTPQPLVCYTRSVTETTTDLTKLHPREIDRLFADAWHAESSALNKVIYLSDHVHGSSGHYYEARLAEAREELLKAREALAPLDAEWDRRGGWTRYWLVVNYDGHVHRDRSCPTTFPTTQWAFPYDLSGMNEDELIASVGRTACTVCFPNAPVHPAFIRSEQEAREAEEAKRNALCEGSGEPAQNVTRVYSPYATCHVCGKRGVSVTRRGLLRGHKTPEQDKAELVAKVAADPKKILGADGEYLRDMYGSEVKAVQSAKNTLVEALWRLERGDTETRDCGKPRKLDDIRDEFAAALAAKQGVTVEEVLAGCERALKTRRKRGY